MIYIATLPNKFFGRKHFAWQSIDVDYIISHIRSIGLDCQSVEIGDLHDVNLNGNDIIWGATFCNKDIHEYVVDNFNILSRRARVVPRLELFFAYENKGYQHLLGKQLGLKSPGGAYVFNSRQIRLPTPFVLKSSWGAGSRSVFLVNDTQNGSGYRTIFRSNFIGRIKVLLKKYILNPENFREYIEANRPVGRAIVQEFQSGLKHDWKVLVFGSRYYTLRRSVRPNDFRASGSGKFDFDAQPPQGLLEFARECFHIIDAPYVSLDIGDVSGKFVLFEYQGLNFGPTTMTKSTGWYEFGQAGTWEKHDGKTMIDEVFVNAFIEYVRRKDLI